MRLMLLSFLPLMSFMFFISSRYYLALCFARPYPESQRDLDYRAYLSWFLASLYFQAAVLILTRAHFARNDTARPTMFTIISTCFCLDLALVLTGSFTPVWSVWPSAFSVSSTINAFLLWFNLKIPWRNLFYDTANRNNFLPLVGGTILSVIGFLLAQKIAPYLYSQLSLGFSVRSLINLIFGLVMAVGSTICG